MSVIYCHRGGHHVDSDFHEYFVLSNGEDCCVDCLKEDELCEECGEPFKGIVNTEYHSICKCEPDLGLVGESDIKWSDVEGIANRGLAKGEPNEKG